MIELFTFMVVFQKVARDVGAVKVTSLESGADTCRNTRSQFADAEFTAISRTKAGRNTSDGTTKSTSNVWRPEVRDISLLILLVARADNHRVGRAPTGGFANQIIDLKLRG